MTILKLICLKFLYERPPCVSGTCFNDDYDDDDDDDNRCICIQIIIALIAIGKCSIFQGKISNKMSRLNTTAWY